jgi:4-hydroxy-tetrahydrodipicolinate synthase
MTTDIRQRLAGIHAATIVPMTLDFRIDEAALERHIASVAGTPGIRGLLVNGHAGENFVLTAAEKRRVVEIARRAAPPSCLVCSGVNAESSLDVAREAEAAEAAGADILLVFPPNSWALGHDEACVDIHHAHVRAVCSLPLLIYGAPVGAGAMAYSPAVLHRLAAEPRIIGVKEGSWEVAAYEANRRLLKSLRPDFVVMGSGDEHLLTSYIVGSDGSQVSLAAVVPELLVALHAHAEAGDWAAARAVHERIYPLAAAIYRDPPGGRATARLKACLQLQGRVANAFVRPPQPAVSDRELAALKHALAAAGIGDGPAEPLSARPRQAKQSAA